MTMETDMFGYPPVIPHVMAVWQCPGTGTSHSGHGFIELRTRFRWCFLWLMLWPAALSSSDMEKYRVRVRYMIESFRYMIIYVYNWIIVALKWQRILETTASEMWSVFFVTAASTLVACLYGVVTEAQGLSGLSDWDSSQITDQSHRKKSGSVSHEKHSRMRAMLRCWWWQPPSLSLSRRWIWYDMYDYCDDMTFKS